MKLHSRLVGYVYGTCHINISTPFEPFRAMDCSLDNSQEHGFQAFLQVNSTAVEIHVIEYTRTLKALKVQRVRAPSAEESQCGRKRGCAASHSFADWL